MGAFGTVVCIGLMERVDLNKGLKEMKELLKWLFRGRFFPD